MTKQLRWELQDPLVRSFSGISDQVASLTDAVMRELGSFNEPGRNVQHYKELSTLSGSSDTLISFAMKVLRSTDSHGARPSLGGVSTTFNEFEKLFQETVNCFTVVLRENPSEPLTNRLGELLEEFDVFAHGVTSLTPAHLALQLHLSHLTTVGLTHAWPGGSKDLAPFHDDLRRLRDYYFARPKPELITEYLSLAADLPLSQRDSARARRMVNDPRLVEEEEFIERYTVELETLALMAVLEETS
jgi:hypothetical protein